MKTDKEKEIEEMAFVIGRKNFLCAENCNDCSQIKDKCRLIKHATILVGAGYGNVKQAIEKFTERLKDKILSFRFCDVVNAEQEYYHSALNDVLYEIDNLIKELYDTEIEE